MTRLLIIALLLFLAVPARAANPQDEIKKKQSQLDKLRKAYIPLTDPAQRKAAIEAIQKRFYEVMPYAITGQFQSPVAYRKNVVGIPKTLVLTSWNTEKK